MTKLSRRQIDSLAKLPTDQLLASFDAIGTIPAHRIKSGHFKGCVKRTLCRYGDVLLAEISRRRSLEG